MTTTTKPGSYGLGLREVVHAILADSFEGGHYLSYSDGGFRHFNGTHWAELSEDELGRIVWSHAAVAEATGRQRTPSLIRDVITGLRHATAVPGDHGRREAAAPIINVANGELWFEVDGAVCLRPHDPGSGHRDCLNVAYDPQATCPQFDAAITRIFSASGDGNRLTAFWHEFSGYILQPQRHEPLIVVGWGKGRDGKSALAELLMHQLSHGRSASMPVEDLQGSRFVMGDLAGKHLFVDDDMASGARLPDGMLKKMSEGTTVTAERKFRDPVTFAMTAVPLLLGNNVPILRDRSAGFRRRLVVLPFDRQFGKDEVDYGLFPRIRATEMPGVLNRAVNGLQRLIQRGWQFDLPDAVAVATEAWWAEATGTQVPNENDREKQPAQRSRARAKPLAVKPDRVQVSGHEAHANADAQGTSPGLHLNLEVPLQCESATVNFMANGQPAELRFSCVPNGTALLVAARNASRR
ncbi:DNA primase family protein [Methylobacterium sp. CM6247]